MSINEILFKKCWVQSIEETGLQLKLRKRLLGVQPQMQRFNYYYRVLISQKILEHSDKSSESIQCADLTAIDAKNLVNCTIKLLIKCDVMMIFNCFGLPLKRKLKDLAQQNLLYQGKVALPNKCQYRDILLENVF